MFQPVFVHLIQSLIVPLCSLLPWGLGLLLIWRVGATARFGMRYLQRLHQIPCDRCAFYTGECQLKCTVHPLTAFSETAINCRDFEPSIASSSRLRSPCPAHTKVIEMIASPPLHKVRAK